MKTIKSIITALLALASATIGFSAYAEENMYHGTNCMTANQAQGDLFLWNKDGLTNNSNIDLFVICPIDFDRGAWDASPELDIEVEIFMPPGYTNSADGSATGPQCLARFFRPDNLTATDDQVVIDSQSFTVGPFSGNAVLGDSDVGNANVTATIANDGNAHLLCLIPPNGGTLLRYSAEQI